MRSLISFLGAMLLLFILTLSGPLIATAQNDDSQDQNNNNQDQNEQSSTSVPEPGTAALLGSLAASGIIVRKIVKHK